MFTQGADQGFNSSAGQQRASRGDVALFTDSMEGIGAIAARSLTRDGYSVTLYCVVNRELTGSLTNRRENAPAREEVRMRGFSA